MNIVDEAADTRRKTTGKAAAVFLVVMLLLTFFSSTINNFTMPKVTYEAPASGALLKEAAGTGNVEAKTVHDLYVRSNLRVTGVMVKAGDEVKQGQTLLTLDTTDIEKQLKDEQDRCAQKRLQLERLLEAGSPDSLLGLDKAVQTALQNAEKARRNYDSSKSLYEAGAIPANDLEDARINLENAGTDYEIAKKNRDKAAKDNGRDIESIRLDIAMAEREIAWLSQEGGMGTVTAPCDGIVTGLYYSQGMTANSSQPLYEISDTKGGFQFVAAVDVTAAQYLEPGDGAEVSISSLNGRVIQGKVSRIRDNQQQPGVKKDVTIDISSQELIGGESGTAYLKKSMGAFKVLVPNSALGQDNDGYFVYVLKDKKGPLGNEFYAEKVSVNTGDSDNIKTAVLSGISAGDRVISSSDKPLSDGMRVMPAK